MRDKDLSTDPAPAAISASEIEARLRPLSELSIRHPLFGPAPEVRPEAQAERRAALLRLRQLALDVAQSAADGVVEVDAEMAQINDRIRRTVRELSRDPSRPLHERMLIVGLWRPLPDLPRRTQRVLRRRREAAGRRRAAGQG